MGGCFVSEFGTQNAPIPFQVPIGGIIGKYLQAHGRQACNLFNSGVLLRPKVTGINIGNKEQLHVRCNQSDDTTAPGAGR